MKTEESNQSFSLGRLDVVDLYEWKTQGKLVYQTYFQRQFVWREKDKRDLIDTIMKGYPIPAIFICDAGTDYSVLSKRYNVLDGRQRLESIFEFLDNQFKYKDKYYNEMNKEEKKQILNYNITLIQMYIDPEDTEKIKEVFKRLNKNAYNLNRMERQSTQLVEYDYMIIAKIVSGIIRIENVDDYLCEIRELFSDEGDSDGNELSSYSIEKDSGKDISDEIKEICKMENIRHIYDILTSDIVFSQYDKQRQISLQYFLNIFTCILTDDIIHRNVTEKIIIKLSAKPKSEIKEKLLNYNKTCKLLLDIYNNTNISDFWKNKTSFLSLSIILENYIDQFEKMGSSIISEKLNNFQDENRQEWIEYNEASKQGVNDKKERERRNELLKRILMD